MVVGQSLLPFCPCQQQLALLCRAGSPAGSGCCAASAALHVVVHLLAVVVVLHLLHLVPHVVLAVVVVLHLLAVVVVLAVVPVLVVKVAAQEVPHNQLEAVVQAMTVHENLPVS